MGQDESFGARLRRHRERAGLSQEELAARAGLTANAISALERGERQRPYPHTVQALAEALGLDEPGRLALTAAVPPRRSGVAPVSAITAPADAPGMGLPGSLTGLIGRESETAVALQLLGRPGVQLLTLTGPGGVGKTRLALAVAEAARAWFPDGLAFVDLAPLRDPAAVARTIARMLGAREAGDTAPVHHLASVLGVKRLLVVLDNVEHVAEAAPDVAALLRACPGLKVLATSRAPLRVRGEQEYRVPPLVVPGAETTADPDALLAFSAVRLFVERARSAMPDFALTPKNAAAVTAICARLEGLPLALELAAARVALLPPPVLRDRLAGSLGVLTGGARDLPARQRTMRDAIAWSYDLLDPGEQALFARLAVFAGGSALEAVESVCPADGDDAPMVLDQLAALLRDNLLVRESADGSGDGDDGDAGDEAEGVRIRMLEPIRAYAGERLMARGEEAALRRRHATYYAALATAARAHLTGPGQLVWLGRLVREGYNLRAATRAMLDAGDTEGAVVLVWALWRYWWLQGLQREARRWMEEVLAGGQPLSPPRRAEALLTVGTMAWSEGNAAVAVPALEEGLRLCRETGNTRGEAIALLFLGLCVVGERDSHDGEAEFEESLRLFRAVGEDWAAALVLSYLGLVPLLRGEYDRATHLFEESLTVARAAGDRVPAHQALYGLGLLAQARGADTDAAAYFAEGITLVSELGDRVNVGYFLTGLGEVAATRGQAVHAARLLGAAEAVLQATNSPPHRNLPEQPWHARARDAARAALGPTAFAHAQGEGRALSLAGAITAALAVTADLTGDQRDTV